MMLRRHSFAAGAVGLVALPALSGASHGQVATSDADTLTKLREVLAPRVFDAMLDEIAFDDTANRLAATGFGREARNIIAIRTQKRRAFAASEPKISAQFNQLFDQTLNCNDVQAAQGILGSEERLVRLVTIMRDTQLTVLRGFSNFVSPHQYGITHPTHPPLADMP